MKISSGILIISITSFINGPVEGGTNTFETALDQFYSILKHNTDTVDILLDLSASALATVEVEPFIKLIRAVNKTLFKYMHDLYTISTEANYEPEPILSPIVLTELAQICNHSAVLKEALEGINNTVSELRLGNGKKVFQLMPMGPPRTFLVVNPNPPGTYITVIERMKLSEPTSSNLEELLSNVEDAMAAKRWVFEFILGFLTDLPVPRQPHTGIALSTVDKMHDTLFKLLEALKYTARDTPGLEVDDFMVAESTKLRKIASSIQESMTAMDISLYGYGFGYAPLNYKY